MYKNYICLNLRTIDGTQDKEVLLSEVKNDSKEINPQNQNDANEHLKKYFECPVCFEIMALPRRIYACSNNHFICSICLDLCMNDPKLAKSCVECRDDFTKNRPQIQYTSQKMLEDLWYDFFILYI